MLGRRINVGPQTAFLASTAREVLYGGAAGGGKSDALLALLARWADHPRHRGVMLRRTRPQLQEVIDRAKELYGTVIPGADWIERESRFRLPAGGFIRMGYAEHEDDILQFKSDEYNVVAFDEATSFTPTQYKFMFSRNRTKAADLPSFMRAGSNPGDISHEFFYNRFIVNKEPYRIYEEITELSKGYSVSLTRQYIPAKVFDNPKLGNRDEYIAGLLEMGEEGLMYLHGVWTQLGGTMFKKLPEQVPPKLASSDYYIVRSLDYGLVDPTCVLWLVVYPSVDPKHTVIDIAGEVYVNEMNIDNLAKTILEYERDVLGLKEPLVSVADPKIFSREGTSMQSVATMLDERGVHFEKANNDRVAGWAQVQRYLYRGSMRQWITRAPNLGRSMPILLRDPKKPNDIKQHQEDHSVDTLRYGAMAVYENLANAVPTQEQKQSDANRDVEYDKMMAALQQGGQRSQIPELGIW